MRILNKVTCGVSDSAAVGGCLPSLPFLLLLLPPPPPLFPACTAIQSFYSIVPVCVRVYRFCIVWPRAHRAARDHILLQRIMFDDPLPFWLKSFAFR